VTFSGSRRQRHRDNTTSNTQDIASYPGSYPLGEVYNDEGFLIKKLGSDRNRGSPLLLCCPSFYSGAGPLPPQDMGREGLPQGAKGWIVVPCYLRMDSVHGHKRCNNPWQGAMALVTSPSLELCHRLPSFAREAGLGGNLVVQAPITKTEGLILRTNCGASLRRHGACHLLCHLLVACRRMGTPWCGAQRNGYAPHRFPREPWLGSQVLNVSLRDPRRGLNPPRGSRTWLDKTPAAS
jgi:hypothetical protein